MRHSGVLQLGTEAAVSADQDRPPLPEALPTQLANFILSRSANAEGRPPVLRTGLLMAASHPLPQIVLPASQI